MSWWKRWKAKHWDERWILDPPEEKVGMGGYIHQPPLRRVLARAWADVVAHRWVALSIAAVIIAALISRW